MSENDLTQILCWAVPSQFSPLLAVLPVSEIRQAYY